MKYTFGIPAIAALLVTFAACRKDHGDAPAPPQAQWLSVKIDQPYLTAAQVDSAFAIWKVNGQEQQIKMTLQHDSLLAPLEAFTEGDGVLTLLIYSNKKYSNQYDGRFVSKKTVSLQRTIGLHYKGPASFYDSAWLPRVHLSDAIGHHAVVALRPDDPYFLVYEPGHAMHTYVVERSYWKGINGAGGAVWTCKTGCAGTADENFFSSLPQKIGSTPWNHISITVLFQINANGEGWVLSLEYEP